MCNDTKPVDQREPDYPLPFERGTLSGATCTILQAELNGWEPV